MNAKNEHRKPAEQDDLYSADQQPTAFKGMDTGTITPHGDSMHDEGKTTSRVNRAAEDRTDTGDDAPSTAR